MPATPRPSDRYHDGLGLVGRSFDTSEIRWFAPGPPPASVVAWFSDRGSSASVEIRHDAYRIAMDHGIGLKRRDHGPLELKRRRGIAPRCELAPGFAGRIEEWSKCGVEEPLGNSDWQWSVVDKVVLTRTFAPDEDGSIVETRTRTAAAPACDIELATVTVGDLVAWTFALEAWGEPALRRSLVDESLAALLDRLRPAPRALVGALDLDMGYPEWLVERIWADERITR